MSAAAAAIAAELAYLGEAGVALFDVHSHTGADIDGSNRSAAQQLAAIEPYGGRSAIFPFCVEGSYAAENLRVAREAEDSGGRLVAFARLDPRDEPGAAAETALATGARGFKLHPRSEDFRLDHSGVDAIVGVAAEVRAPVLIHAGLGVGSFGGTILELAERHPACPIVLAHAAISDLGWIWREVPGHPNLFFDTSWWNPSDLIALFALVPPGRILFGSDAPYMNLEAVLAITLRCGRAAGLRREAIELVMGRQLENLLAGAPAVDAGPAPGPPRAVPSPAAARAVAALVAAGSAKLSGGDPAQMFELARLAVGDGSALGEAGPLVAELLDEGATVTQDAVWALAMALTLLLTPGVESAVAAS